MNSYFEKILWRLFPFFEKLGIHVLPIHFYSPIPDIRQINRHAELFDKPYPMHGIDMRMEHQLSLLREAVVAFESEYINESQNLGIFGVDQKKMPSFAPFNALALYAFIRYFKPKNVIEIGSGMSTRISSMAMDKNASGGSTGDFVAIEPYPTKELLNGYKGLKKLIVNKVENIPSEFFSCLKENDILFIDSSHTVKIFGDVNYLFLNIIPQLNPGVIIHIHDIFFPFDYLPHHFLRSKTKQIWQEQYLLHAFLMFNSEYEVLFSSGYLHSKHLNDLTGLFPWYHAERFPSSFWMRRKRK